MTDALRVASGVSRSTLTIPLIWASTGSASVATLPQQGDQGWVMPVSAMHIGPRRVSLTIIRRSRARNGSVCRATPGRADQCRGVGHWVSASRRRPELGCTPVRDRLAFADVLDRDLGMGSLERSRAPACPRTSARSARRGGAARRRVHLVAAALSRHGLIGSPSPLASGHLRAPRRSPRHGTSPSISASSTSGMPSSNDTRGAGAPVVEDTLCLTQRLHDGLRRHSGCQP
jgi:hypothetical protein